MEHVVYAIRNRVKGSFSLKIETAKQFVTDCFVVFGFYGCLNFYVRLQKHWIHTILKMLDSNKKKHGMERISSYEK